MRRLILALLFIILAKQAFNKDQPITSVNVQYIANSGFLVNIDNTYLLFDALFRDGLFESEVPSEETALRMANAQPPFDSIHYVFVSHAQADHFNAEMAIQFMTNNYMAKLYCPVQVHKKLMAQDSVAYFKFKNRVNVIDIETNSYVRLTDKKNEIIACKIQHMYENYIHVDNLAFVVNIKGTKIYHSGDSSPETLDDLRGLSISDLGIDIAFITDEHGLYNAGFSTIELINARYYVLMDIQKQIMNFSIKNFCEKCNIKPQPVFFKKKDESLDFYINDYFEDQNE